MGTLLQVYHDHAAEGRPLSVDRLAREGYSRNHARVLLHRLKQEGVAQPAGRGRVRLVPPGEPRLQEHRDRTPPWEKTLRRRFTVKPTGFSVLSRRYPQPLPHEFMMPPGQVPRAAALLRRNYPRLKVYEDRFLADSDTVCLYSGRVRGDKATQEEALIHVYRHAPRKEFSLALQALLMEHQDLNWDWLRRQPEWSELAGVFVAVNELAGRKIFPAFRTTEPPDLSALELGTVAQPFTARGKEK